MKAPIDHIYITVGPNCWGKADTAEQSLKNARVNFPRWTGKRRLKRYFVTKLVHSSATVDPVDGAIRWQGHDAKNCPHCEVGK